MSSQIVHSSSTPEDSPFRKADEPFALLHETDRYLDRIVFDGTPDHAYEIEDELLKLTEKQQRISSRFARVSLKAIAISQYARQYEADAHYQKDQTYQKLGQLIDKTHTSALYAKEHIDVEAGYAEHRNLIGILSETAIYTLLAFDNKMEHSLSGRKRSIPTHFTLPATHYEDIGHRITDDTESRTGFDFKLFTNYEDERVIPLQVKTSRQAASTKVYSPDIAVISLDAVLPENQTNETLLATLIAKDAAGSYDATSKQQLNTAVRNLDQLIIKGGIAASDSPKDTYEAIA